MATPAQIAANRANALKSTGPRTAEGRAASRFNAIKHALDAESLVIPGEDSAEFEAFAAGYHDEFRPAPFRILPRRSTPPTPGDRNRNVLAESGGTNLVTAILSGTPAAKLSPVSSARSSPSSAPSILPNAEFLRARRETQAAEDEAFETFIDRACAIPPSSNWLRFLKTAR
jgi:hypothetical protein